MAYIGGMDLADEIREAAAWVAGRAELVRIDRERLAGYAAGLPLTPGAPPELDPERHYLGRGEATLAYLICLDAINFGSGWFPSLAKRPGCSGYFTVAWSLKDHFAAAGPLDAARLQAADARTCAAIFGQDPANREAMELMGLFAQAWNDLGEFLAQRHGGSFAALVESAGGSAWALAAELARMPFFRDESLYQGRRVPFYKRAQITAADLALAFPDHPWGRFHDRDRLTIFADNLVPHVLRLDGILLYDPGLAGRIDAGELIASGSPEEVEIRASALHAVELMLPELARLGRPSRAADLDMVLWSRGQGRWYKKTKPRHRARSMFY